MTKLLKTKEPVNNSFAVALCFQELALCSSDGGTNVPEHFAEVHLIFVLIKNVHLLGK
jgi:hypothetical protein